MPDNPIILDIQGEDGFTLDMQDSDGLDFEAQPFSKGDPGKSAYQSAVDCGFEGTEEEWLASLVGPQGPTGSTGPQGSAGPQGQTGPQGVAGNDGFSPTATVTKSGSVATITITDKNGTTTATVNEGVTDYSDLTNRPTKLSDFADDLGSSPTHTHSQYLTSYTETDPVFTASAAHGITSSDISDWNGKVDDLADLGITATATELNYTDGVTSNIQDQLDAMAKAVSYTASGAIASFTAEADNMPVTSLVANIEPKQSGSGDPSPSNVRPISGWTGCNVTRTGKNLLPYTVQGAYKTADGIPIVSNTYVRSPKIIAKPDVTYWIRASVASVTFLFWDVNGNFISGTDRAGVGNRYLTAPSNAHYVAFNFYSNTGNITPETVGNIMVNVGSGFADYEPYTSEAISVSWQDEAGTVYGGTIDVATGLLTVTNGYIASYNGETLPSTWISDRDVYSSGTTPTTGAQVVYVLATPQTYQLTPQQLLTLLGTNNVWADTGDVSVAFVSVISSYLVDKGTYSSGQLLQDRNLAYVESSARASRAYSVNNYFINADGVLCRITASVSSGGTLIKGTNYIVVTGGLANDLYSLLS